MLANIEYTPQLAAATAASFERVKSVIPSVEWPVHAPYVQAINRLKAERNAVVLAHNYQTPEIFHCVADITGDSLALARRAQAEQQFYDFIVVEPGQTGLQELLPKPFPVSPALIFRGHLSYPFSRLGEIIHLFSP